MIDPIRPAPTLIGQKYVVFFCVYQGAVLLAKRRDGGWSCGSGTVDPGEEPVDCMLREVEEEFRLRPISFLPLGLRGPIHDFWVELPSQQAINAAPEEHSELQWFDGFRPDMWLHPWHPRFAEFIRINYGMIRKLMRPEVSRG